MDVNTMPEKWIWAFDPSTPTNRDNAFPFEKGKTPTTILDYFLISPNVELLTAKNIDLGFKNSDHNPVYVKVRLLQD
jgi:hypothetical protein